MLRLILFCLLFCVAGNTFVSAQVYHYLPVSYSDPEINPSVILSDRNYSHYALQHANSFLNTDPFSVSRFSVHKRLHKIYCGTALTFTNTNYNRKTYNSYAISFVYRTILFNKIYLRPGITAKLIQNNSSSGYHDLFSFLPDENSAFKQFTANFNYNLALVSGLERFYVTVSYLNHQPFIKTDSLLFPRYLVVQAGNLASFFVSNNTNHQINFVYFTKRGNNDIMYNQFYTSLFYALKVNRKTTMLIGGRIGYSTEKYFHYLPSICFNRDKFMLTFTYSFYDSSASHTQLISTLQTQLNFNIKWSRNKYSQGVSF